MRIRFYSKDASLNNAQQETMEKKLHHRLGKFLPGDDDELFVKVSERNKLFKVELNMQYGGYHLRTEAQERNNAIAALDSGMDAMEGQVRKCKTKQARSLRPNAVQAASDYTEQQAAAPEAEYHIVKVKQYEMKPMTAVEAVVLMELLGHNFYMFNNSELGKACTVYRRNDGDYGMITAE